MKKLILLLLSYCMLATIVAQNEMSSIDSLLNQTASKKTTHLKKIKIGSLRTGTAYFYLKTTKEVFSIVNRKSYSSSTGHLDSASEYKYLFLKNKLVKVIHSRTKSNPFRYGYTYLYFNDNKLIGSKEFKDYPIPNIEYVMTESTRLLSKAKELISSKD